MVYVEMDTEQYPGTVMQYFHYNQSKVTVLSLVLF